MNLGDPVTTVGCAHRFVKFPYPDVFIVGHEGFGGADVSKLVKDGLDRLQVEIYEGKSAYDDVKHPVRGQVLRRTEEE